MPLPSLHLVLAGLFLGLVALAAAWDVCTLRIPNRLTLLIAALWPAYGLAAPSPPDWPIALAIGAAAFALGTLCFGFGLLGGGDVKLIAAVALWAGPALVLPFVLATALVGGALAFLLLSPIRYAIATVWERVGATAMRDLVLGEKLPYGVAIAAGALIVVGPALLTP